MLLRITAPNFSMCLERIYVKVYGEIYQKLTHPHAVHTRPSLSSPQEVPGDEASGRTSAYPHNEYFELDRLFTTRHHFEGGIYWGLIHWNVQRDFEGGDNSRCGEISMVVVFS